MTKKEKIGVAFVIFIIFADLVFDIVVAISARKERAMIYKRTDEVLYRVKRL